MRLGGHRDRFEAPERTGVAVDATDNPLTGRIATVVVLTNRRPRDTR
jgi:hypothetical protein